MSALFHSFIYEPIYNALAAVVSVVPGGDLGVAIIIITVLVRLILFPLSLKAIRTQIAMRDIDPKLKAIREKNKGNNEVIARETMALFKEHKVNPLAGFFLILIQLPVIFGLYFVFLGGIKAGAFDPTGLYSFISAPAHVSFSFLGLLDLTEKSIILAVIVAVTQFLYARIATPPPAPKPASGSVPSFKEDFGRSMQFQMRYVFPVILGVVSYLATAAVALYFAASNIFMLAQELTVRRIHNHEKGKNP